MSTTVAQAVTEFTTTYFRFTDPGGHREAGFEAVLGSWPIWPMSVSNCSMFRMLRISCS